MIGFFHDVVSLPDDEAEEEEEEREVEENLLTKTRQLTAECEASAIIVLEGK